MELTTQCSDSEHQVCYIDSNFCASELDCPTIWALLEMTELIRLIIKFVHKPYFIDILERRINSKIRVL